MLEIPGKESADKGEILSERDLFEEGEDVEFGRFLKLSEISLKNLGYSMTAQRVIRATSGAVCCRKNEISVGEIRQTSPKSLVTVWRGPAAA